MKLSSLTEKPIDVNTNLVTTVDGGGVTPISNIAAIAAEVSAGYSKPFAKARVYTNYGEHAGTTAANNDGKNATILPPDQGVAVKITLHTVPTVCAKKCPKERIHDTWWPYVKDDPTVNVFAGASLEFSGTNGTNSVTRFYQLGPTTPIEGASVDPPQLIHDNTERTYTVTIPSYEISYPIMSIPSYVTQMTLRTATMFLCETDIPPRAGITTTVSGRYNGYSTYYAEYYLGLMIYTPNDEFWLEKGNDASDYASLQMQMDYVDIEYYH